MLHSLASHLWQSRSLLDMPLWPLEQNSRVSAGFINTIFHWKTHYSKNSDGATPGTRAAYTDDVISRSFTIVCTNRKSKWRAVFVYIIESQLHNGLKRCILFFH